MKNPAPIKSEWSYLKLFRVSLICDPILPFPLTNLQDTHFLAHLFHLRFQKEGLSHAHFLNISESYIRVQKRWIKRYLPIDRILKSSQGTTVKWSTKCLKLDSTSHQNKSSNDYLRPPLEKVKVVGDGNLTIRSPREP